jgi:16S rRNA processing protein RimM
LPRRLADTAGPEPTTPVDQVRLAIGRLGGPHGVSGELHLHLTTDDPEHVQSITRVFLEGEERPRRVMRLRLHGSEALIRFRGVTTPEAARALHGRVVRIAGADARPPAPGEFFLYQLVGLNVRDESGAELGIVTDVLETGANDVFVISLAGGGPDLLIPHVPEVVLDIVPSEGRMVIRPPLYYGEDSEPA